MNREQRAAPAWIQIVFALAFLFIVGEFLLVKPATITVLASRSVAMVAETISVLESFLRLLYGVG